MKKKNSNKRIAGIILSAILGVLVLTAGSCMDNRTASNSGSNCSFVAGNGNDGHDAKLHKVVLPNNKVDFDDSREKATYVPCGPRNWIINNGTQRDANGALIGDDHSPTVAYTSSDVKIKVQSGSYWILNQDENAMRAFYIFCAKYQCASNKRDAGDVNFSTKGWNGMLGENFGVSVDSAIQQAASQFDDDIWKTHNIALYKQLGKAASNLFADQIRQVTGYNTNLFCGSGNSGWDESGQNFTCSNVRIVIRDVQPANSNLQETAARETQADQDKKSNAKRLEAAKEVYGDQAPYWLGLQDTLKLCKKPATCVVSIGGNAPSVSVPTGNGS